MVQRPSERQFDQTRRVTVTHNFTRYAEGSVLIAFGETKVLCNATVEPGVPRFLEDQEQGWITAEYSMLPRSTHSRMRREVTRGKPGGRTLEIQRLIGRSLRACIDLKALGPYTITVDCDVIQADGGTRTAAITGAWLAVKDAIEHLQQNGQMDPNSRPLTHQMAAVSVGLYQGQPVVDLDYDEDSQADADINVVMDENQGLIEIQGTAESHPFDEQQFATMMQLAKAGIANIIHQTCATK